MTKEQCTNCAKVTERYINGVSNWYCRYNKKFIADTEKCEAEKKFQRKCCPICKDIIDNGQTCVCKGNPNWVEGV